MSKPSYTIEQAAVLVALASGLQVLESFFPHPVPGVRLGLANIITMIALVRIGARAAIEISVLRVFISAMFTGTIFTPAFFIGLSGAVCSSVLMVLFYKATIEKGFKILSLTGISVLGAAAHNAAQLGVVYFVFIKSTAVLSFAPVLGISAVAAGIVTGAVASAAIRASEKKNTPGVFALKNNIEKKESVIYSIPARITALIAADTAVLMSASAQDFIICSAALLFSSLLMKGSLFSVLTGLKRMSFFIVISFSVPFLFGGAAEALTGAAAAEGAVYASRVALLIGFASCLLYGIDWTRSAEKGVFSMRPFKIAAGSYAMLPGVVDGIKESIKAGFGSGLTVKTAFEKIGYSVASLYTETVENKNI